MKKMWDWTQTAFGLLLGGYAVCVALIAAWPNTAFWLIAALVILEVL